MQSGKSDAIAQAIINQLQKDKLNICKFLGLGVDGASVNVGSKHSLSTTNKFQNFYNSMYMSFIASGS